MKIVVIGPLPDPINGCSLANQTLIKYLVENNYQISTINTNMDAEIQGVQGKFSWIKLISFIRVYLKLLKILTVNVVYITPGQSFWGIIKYAPFILLAYLLNKPIVMHVHGNYLGTQYRLLGGFKKKIFKFLISRSSAGIVLSESLKENFDGLLEEKKIFVVENFANNELIVEERVNKNHSFLQILWLSNLMREKGILDFLDALILLKSKNHDFKAIIAGKIEDGLEPLITEKISELGKLAEYVGTVHGSYKKELLVKSNLFVFPTYYTMEGQPIALIEAMATGNIIITTNHAGIPDIVSSKNGYLIQPKDVNALTNTIAKISDNLNQEVGKFSENNCIYVKNNFTEDAFGKKILDVLHMVTEKNKQRCGT